jgi:hypothetical protein
VNWLPIVAAGISLLGSLVMALVAWGWRGQIDTLRAENNVLKADMLTAIQKAVNQFATLPGRVDTLKAETRAALAESVNEFYKQVNGNYVKKDLYIALVSRVDSVEARVNDLGD